MTGFTFFQNYYEAVCDDENGLTEEEQGRLYNAIFAYIFHGEEPNLKGACKLAFSLIVGEVQREEHAKNENKENGKKGGRPRKTPVSEIKKGGFSDKNPGYENEKGGFEVSEQKEDPLTEKERSKEKEYNPQEKDNPPCSPPREETDETVKGYLAFMREHPSIQEDLDNPSAIAEVDFPLLAQKISESKRYLQQKKSLKWLLSHYREIIGDSYKDFSSDSPPELPQGKGDLQLWQELMRALSSAQNERYCEELGYELPAFRMADEESKAFMAELYKGLSAEITGYFDPNSFLELCEMDGKDLKFERARFLKALPDIRRKIMEANNGVG